MEIPSSYTISKFMQYAGKPTSNRSYYNGSCPICREGKHWQKKKRLYFFPSANYLYCHNCSRSWLPYFWIKEVSGMTYHEIVADMKDYMGDDINYTFINTSQKEEEIFQVPDLPGECVNLSDPTQVKFYKNNKIVQLAFNYCKQRRLFTALNAPKSIFVCIEDTFHKNRLVIPYYQNNKIVCYVTRQLLDTDTKAKYLIKFNADKPLFNFDKIDVNYPYIFIIEGPIDSMFLKNSTSITGIHLTAVQEKLLTSSFPLHEHIWVYDNPKFEDAIVVKKITDKLKDGEKVFLYDGDLAEFKDLNAYCTQKNLDFVNPDLIVAGSYTGNVGLMRIN